jgi:hypothetical protein
MSADAITGQANTSAAFATIDPRLMACGILVRPFQVYDSRIKAVF